MAGLRFRFPRLAPRSPVSSLPAQTSPVTSNEIDDSIPEPAFDWSEVELDVLSMTSEDDLADTRAWLKRVGFAEAVELFDA